MVVGIDCDCLMPAGGIGTSEWPTERRDELGHWSPTWLSSSGSR